MFFYVWTNTNIGLLKFQPYLNPPTVITDYQAEEAGTPC